MKRLLALAALPLMAQTAPPAAVTMENGVPRVVNPTATYCLSGGVWVGCAPSSGGGGGTTAATPTGTAGSPAAQVVSVQGVSGGTPQPTAVTSSVLPTGAATAANQTTMQTTLAGVSTESTQLAVSAKLPASLGAKTGATSLSVVPASDGFNVVARGSAAIATGQVLVGTTATLIAAARTLRQRITVTVTTAVGCAFGNSGVTLTTGYPLAAVAGASDTTDTTAALYGVCASTATVGYKEIY